MGRVEALRLAPPDPKTGLKTAVATHLAMIYIAEKKEGGETRVSKMQGIKSLGCIYYALHLPWPKVEPTNLNWRPLVPLEVFSNVQER